MSVDTLLGRLEGVRSTGAGRWIARCPAHEDRRPSLAIRELDDGRVLVHDFGGCSAVDVLAAVGLELAALYPTRTAGNATNPERRPFPAADVLACIAGEALLAAVAAARLAKGEVLDETASERLAVAAARLSAAHEMAAPHG